MVGHPMRKTSLVKNLHGRRKGEETNKSIVGLLVEAGMSPARVAEQAGTDYRKGKTKESGKKTVRW